MLVRFAWVGGVVKISTIGVALRDSFHIFPYPIGSMYGIFTYIVCHTWILCEIEVWCVWERMVIESGIFNHLQQGDSEWFYSSRWSSDPRLTEFLEVTKHPPKKNIMTMEKPPFADAFPIENGDFAMSCSFFLGCTYRSFYFKICSCEAWSNIRWLQMCPPINL